jgi:transposase
VEPLLPQPVRPYRNPGRKRADDRAALAGIVFVFKTRIACNQMPASVCG